MAAGAVTLYDSTAKILMGGGDMTTATIKLALVNSSYTPNSDTDVNWANASANEITGGGTTGYTAGGATIGTPVLTEITKGYKFTSANPTWTAGADTLPAWRYGVLYIVGTVEGVTNPLLGYFIGNTTGPTDIPITTDTNTLTITCPAAGWFDVVRP